MTISIEQGISGWGKYVIYGTDKKPRDQDLIEVIDGNISLNEMIHQSNDFEKSYYRGVLAFDGKYSNEQATIMYEDFKKEFFHGYNKDEYNICAVIHQDTDHTHIHFNVPKQNLKTENELQLYMHSIDMKRKELIQDHLSLKYDMKIARESNQSLIEESKEEYFEEQRAEREQAPFNFSMKTTKDKEAAEREIYLLVEEANKKGVLNNLDDVKELIETATPLKIVNDGFDRKLQKYYITFQNDQGKKYKSKGHLYNPDFWELEQSKRTEQFQDNVRNFDNVDLEKRKVEVKRALRLEQNKRFNKLKDNFKVARDKVNIEFDTININTNLKVLEPIQNKTKEIINEPIINKPTKRKEPVITRAEQSINRTEYDNYHKTRESRKEIFRDITGHSEALQESLKKDASRLSISNKLAIPQAAGNIERVRGKIRNTLNKNKFEYRSKTFQQRIFFDHYKNNIQSDLKNYFINTNDDDITNLINKKKNISITDNGNRLISNTNDIKKVNLEERIRIMLEMAKAKNWDICNLIIKGDFDYIQESNRQIALILKNNLANDMRVNSELKSKPNTQQQRIQDEQKQREQARKQVARDLYSTDSRQFERRVKANKLMHMSTLSECNILLGVERVESLLQSNEHIGLHHRPGRSDSVRPKNTRSFKITTKAEIKVKKARSELEKNTEDFDFSKLVESNLKFDSKTKKQKQKLQVEQILK